MNDVYQFLRPMWMVRLYMAASLLFGAACGLYLLNGNWIFGFAWLVLCMVWYQKWTWVKANPVFEINAREIVAIFGPGRRREIPLAEVSGVEREDDRLLVSLHDGSVIGLHVERLMGPPQQRGSRAASLESFLNSVATPEPSPDSSEAASETADSDDADSGDV